MRNLSDKFKKAILEGRRDFLYFADITLLDGTVLNLDNETLWDRGFKFEDGTSNTGSFDIGAVVIGKLTLTINNRDNSFSLYDFTDAQVVAYIGMAFDDGTTEKYRICTVTVDDPKYNNPLITLECLDNKSKFDRDYSESTLTYPATLLQIIQDACQCCGVPLDTTRFDNDEYVVEHRPDDTGLTFRQIMQMSAQIACKFVKCDPYGRIQLRWYDEYSGTDAYYLTDNRQKPILTGSGEPIIIYTKPAVEPEEVDGGYFDNNIPYQSGDSLDGGVFNPWDESGDDYDAGVFYSMKRYHHIYSLYSLQIGTDDIKVTGVSVIQEDDNGEVTNYLSGNQGYVLAIEKNYLIQDEDQAKYVAASVGKKVIGMVFRTFDATHSSNPAIEAGDTAYVTGNDQNSHKTYITNTTFCAGDTQSSSCGAETPGSNASQRFTEATQILLEAKRKAAKQIDSYDKSSKLLTNLITQSFGVFKTEEKLEDGSVIYYMHNRPTLSESDTIWKMTADAFAVSTDGGKTWNAGMDSSGDVLVNVLSAIGINCDWVRSGTLTLGGEKNMNGVLKILNAVGKVIGIWGKDGITAIGTFRSDDERGNGVQIIQAMIDFLYESKLIAGITCAPNIDPSTGETIGATMMVDIQGSSGAFIVKVGDKTILETDKDGGFIIPEFSGGKTGTANFSDGSYLKFKNGVLIGGKTASGTEF